MHDTALVVLVIGGLMFASSLLHLGLRAIQLPPLVGYIALGFCLRLLDTQVPAPVGGFLDDGIGTSLSTMAELGIAVLLFKVGLEADLKGLIGQLSKATWLWIGNVIGSGGFAYVVARYVLELDLVPSLFVAAALSATSVGISVGAWRDAGVLQTKRGELLIDVAELDDISGVLFVAVLFAVAPLLANDAAAAATGGLASAIAETLVGILIKAALFGGFCYLFSVHLEKRMTAKLMQATRGPELAEIVLSLGLIIAAIAGWLGFSVAIGALFAGVLFSRDPHAVHDDKSFWLVYDLFAPFFFIGVGLQLDPASLVGGLALGLPLVTVAVLGKILGTWLPGLVVTGGSVGLLLGVSLVPRAEIALVIMRQGERLGAWAVSSELYAAMVLVSAVTCLATPFGVKALLKKTDLERDEERPAPRR